MDSTMTSALDRRPIAKTVAGTAIVPPIDIRRPATGTTSRHALDDSFDVSLDGSLPLDILLSGEAGRTLFSFSCVLAGMDWPS